MFGFTSRKPVCSRAPHTDEELWSAFRHLMEKKLARTSYEFISLRAMLASLEQASQGMQPELSFASVCRTFTELYWAAVLRYPEYYIDAPEAAARCVRSYMTSYEMDIAKLSLAVRTKLDSEIGREWQKNAVGVICEGLLYMVYGFSCQEQVLRFNTSALAFMTRNRMQLEELAERALADFVHDRKHIQL